MMSAITNHGSRPPLRLIQGALHDEPGWIWFCGQCAAQVDHESVSPLTRTCPECGRGLLLETRVNAAPTVEDAFLVVDSRLIVRVVSPRARILLGAGQGEPLGRPVARFLAAAGTESGGPEDFMPLLHAASTGSDEIHSLCVRPLGAFGVRVTARIAPCGPPRAALVVLAGVVPAPRRLHVA
jgi:DNA-directed RNA polymerase subunit RPC12/RpoP